MKVGEAYTVANDHLIIVGIANRVDKNVVVGWELMTDKAGNLRSFSEGWRDPKDCIPLVPVVRSDDPSIIALAEVERAEQANPLAKDARAWAEDVLPPSIPLWTPEEEAELLSHKPEVQG